MDSNIAIAVAGIAGTLLGAVVSAIGTHLLQKRQSEKQRKWALEDEERRKGHERETEQRRIKRELLCKRFDILEESIKIMMNHIRSTVGRELGEPMYDDSAELKEQGRRLQSIRGEAWAALVALESKKLMENWRAIASTYSEIEETGTFQSDSWDKAQKAYIQIIKLTDEMRSQV
jgi:gas vesicle protein